MATEQQARPSAAIKAMDKLYEFEREPVPPNKLQPGRHFAGVYAGEHVAGTEFVIGALFVAWGVNAYDVFIGLLLGNLMAVLTWTFVCAPIAVQTRLTLYWYLRKIAGPVTTTVYNILNAVLFCILAGCMITVSASAVRIPFGIPAQTGWFPQDMRFVIVALVVGALVVTLAILGFKSLAKFADVCSPWMFLMFVAGGIVTLPYLASQMPQVGQIKGWSDFWTVATQLVWIGKAPGGAAKISFWHVAAFAWICNLAMHGGLSDMAILRYAKRSSYGLYSAFGMFFGHYVAWICAGIMGAAAALAAGVTIDKMDAGGVAWHALGVTGILTVIIAGWTTSNPTLYRAGLAFQAVTPGWPRWLVTLVAGAVTTVIACSPFVFTKLLDFVGWYGLLLMPVGAIVFAEHWIFPKLGLTQFWATRRGVMVNWPALASWGIAIGTAFILVLTKTLHLFFLFVPVWAFTMVLYVLFASAAGAREECAQAKGPVGEGLAPQTSVPPAGQETGREPDRQASPVLWFYRCVTAGSLLVCIILPFVVFLGGREAFARNIAFFKKAIIWPTLVYFVFGTLWLLRAEKELPQR